MAHLEQIVPLAAMLATGFALALVFGRRKRNAVARLALVFFVLLEAWHLVDYLACLPSLSPYQHGILRVSQAIGISLGVMFLHLAYQLTKRSLGPFFFFCGGLTFVGYVAIFAGDFVISDANWTSTGRVVKSGVLFLPVMSIPLLCIVVSLGLFIWEITGGKEEGRRRFFKQMSGAVVIGLAISILSLILLREYFPSSSCPGLCSANMVPFGLLTVFCLARYDFLDISRYRRAAEILESLGEGIIALSRRGKILQLNRVASRLFEDARRSGKGRSLANMLAEISRDNSAEVQRLEINDAEKPRSFSVTERPVYRRENYQGKLVLFEDITDEVEKEKLIKKSNEKLEEAGANSSERLKHAQKMEALGVLSRGMAHEFNNLLFAIFGFTAAARDDLEKDDPLRADLKEIIVAAKRAKEIVSKIREFSHPEERTRLVVEMSGIIREVGGLLRKLMPASVRFEILAKDVIGLCYVESGQVSRAIMNLGRNAIQASDKEDAFVRLSAEVVRVHEDMEDAYPPLKKAAYVKVSVEDNGTGIPKETQARIFDPFFTTKKRGQGTGLGLSTVFGVMQSHRGAVQVRSKEGEGSTFSIYLPLVDQEAEAKADGDVSASVRVQGGDERILFVDDEQQIARAGKRMLEPLGYRVTALTSSREAMELFRANPQQFDLIVSDYTMPEINGIKMAEEIFVIRPGIPFILITGFAETRIKNPAKQIGVNTVLYKPLTKFHLGQVVRQVLDSQGGDR